MYVLKEPKNYLIDKVGIKGKIFPVDSLTNKLEVIKVTTEIGHSTAIIEHKSDFLYYILEGNGYFLINDVKEECSKGDLVVIPSGTKFTYKGKLELLLIDTPPYKEEQEETL